MLLKASLLVGYSPCEVTPDVRNIWGREERVLWTGWREMRIMSGEGAIDEDPGFYWARVNYLVNQQSSLALCSLVISFEQPALRLTTFFLHQIIITLHHQLHFCFSITSLLKVPKIEKRRMPIDWKVGAKGLNARKGRRDNSNINTRWIASSCIIEFLLSIIASISQGNLNGIEMMGAYKVLVVKPLLSLLLPFNLLNYVYQDDLLHLVHPCMPSSLCKWRGSLPFFLLLSHQK